MIEYSCAPCAVAGTCQRSNLGSCSGIGNVPGYDRNCASEMIVGTGASCNLSESALVKQCLRKAYAEALSTTDTPQCLSAAFILGALWYTVLTGDHAISSPKSDAVAAAAK